MFWLLLLLFLPLCAFLIWTWRTKQKLIATFVQSRLLGNLTVGVSQTRQKIRLALMAVTVLLLILTLARPQWGFSLEEARHQGLDIVVAIDTSRSMLANDLAPNRLTRAKLAALDLMRLAKNDRLGIVAFAGSAFLQTPLTLDEEAFRQNIETLDVGIIPQGGTALSEAIESALTAFEKGTENHKVLVLFTDGEDHDTEALETARKAAEKGLRIFTIGAGTTEGELIRVPDEQGNLTFLKDASGNVVKSRLDETLLQKIATAANGFYLPLRGAKPMEALYAQGLAPLPKSDSTTKLIRQARERYHWPLGIAIGLLLLEMFLPQRKRPVRPLNENSLSSATSMTAMLLLLGTMSIVASTSSALREYEAGNYQAAFEEFSKLSRQKTNDLRLSFNAGAAAYKAGQLEEAQKHFGAATASTDLQLQQQAYYNLGNTLFDVGEKSPSPEEKQKAWEHAVQNFDYSLKLKPEDVDAKHNLEVVKQMLEELKKQQEQQEQQQQQQSNENQEKQDNKDPSENEQSNEQQQNQESQSGQNRPQQDENSSEEKTSEQKSQEEPENPEAGQKPEQQSQPDSKEGEETPEPAQAEEMAAGQMTPEQARRFLDAQKQEDRALIFQPENKESKSKRTIKDW